ncbi:hypothetical protein ALC53_10952 [Atta colombica]|uniref:Uncharacterized protein n=1 Tax=Atta colombica TaxID=520822 RepID=A0A151HZR9_9HYME|nr:hypothetical protein ALC53_10952 [Atta colombica]
MASLSAPLPTTTPPSAAVDIPGRACARIFILQELRRLYNLLVVRRYEVAYARIAITTRLALGDCLAGLMVGDKNRCSTALLFRPLAKRNWAKQLYDDGRNIEDDYGVSRACNPFNVATLT